MSVLITSPQDSHLIPQRQQGPVESFEYNRAVWQKKRFAVRNDNLLRHLYHHT